MNFKIISLMLCMVFLVATATAFEFDNVKSYDPVTREVTITNLYGFGDTIGKARLNTPLNVIVHVGYQKVAEFEITSYRDYDNALKQFTFKDMNNGKVKINREYDLKYLSYEDVEVDDYKTECNKILNINKSYTDVCEKIKISSHTERKAVWNKINPADLKKNEKITVGVFTEVKKGDYVDWIPTIYGREVKEWATWTASLNVDLEVYYTLDEASGTVAEDSILNYNLTNVGATVNQDGILGKSYLFEAPGYGTGDTAYTTTSSIGLTDYPFTYNAWFKGSGTALTWGGIVGINHGIGEWSGLQMGTKAENLAFLNRDDTGGDILEELDSGVDIYTGSWVMVSAVFTSATDRSLWVNGNNVLNTTTNLGFDTDINAFQVGNAGNGEQAPSIAWGGNGYIDEIGVWSRALSKSELEDLYNGGTGITYTNVFIPPNITLNSPTVDANYTTVQNLTINFTAWDDVNLTDVKLYINGALNQTNASGINDSNYLFNVGLYDGDYTINGVATNSQSETANSSSVRFVINTTPFIEFVTPTFINNTNTTSPYIPVNVSLTETYFDNITFNFVTVGDDEDWFWEDDTRFLNDSSFIDGVWKYNVTVCTTTGKCNSTETRTITIDTTDPTINIITPVNDTTTTTIPINVSLNATVTDLTLDTCWYYTTDNSTNITYTCNTLTNVTFSTGGDKTIYVFANDTLGHEAGEETSFLINYVQENAVYNSTVVEGETTTLILNVTASEITTFNGTIRYNGTDYTPTLTNDSTEALLTYTLTAPVVSANTLVYFNWSYTLNGVAYNSSEHNHTIIYLTPLVISTSCDDKAIRFDIVDEENLTALYGEIDYNFKYGLSNGTLKSVYGNISSATTFYACINATVSQNYTIGYGEIQYSNSDHVDRRYYLFEGRKVNNNTIANISLRDLLTIDQTSFLLTMEDTSLNVYAEKYTALWRWYPDLNEYQIVEMGKTDEDGHTVAHVNTEDVDYRIGLYELDGTLIKLGEPLRFICTSAPCSFTLRVGAGEIDYSSIFDIQAEITYNQTSKVFTLIYNDPNSYTSLMRFLVTRESGTNSLIICNDTNAGFTGVMSCNTSEYTGLKKAVAYRSASPPVIIVQKVVSEINTTFNSGFGLFIAVILWLAIVLSGFGNNPIWIIVLGVVGLIPALFFGTINIAIFTGIAVLGAIIIHFIKMAVAR